jgi:hypothetical protein
VSHRLLEPDKWTVGRGKIEEKSDRMLKDLLRCKTLEELHYARGFIEGLQWSIEAVDEKREVD